MKKAGWIVFGVIVVCCAPCLRPSRLSLWTTCVRGPVTPALQDRLSHFINPNRRDLQRVAEYLRRQGVSGSNVCFYNSDFVAMYREMGLTPPTRYVYFYESMRFLPSRREEILNDVISTPHRYVVTDAITTGIPAEKLNRLGSNGPLSDANAQPRNWTQGYPWSEPAVFRAGTYLVHRVDGPITAISVPRLAPKSGTTSATASR